MREFLMGGQRGRSSAILVVGAVVFALLPAWAAHASTITVNSTGNTPDADPGDGFCQDSTGACTLRAAIQHANASPGTDTIEFFIDSGVQIISPTSALPTITDPVVIDGRTQPGWVSDPLITLSGSAAGSASGLVVTAGSSTIRGLAIGGYSGSGIWLQDAGGNVIEGNHLGTNSAGTTANANGQGLMADADSPGNTIGGTAAGAGNLIAGNSFTGLYISSSNNTVAGNRIGGVGTFTPSNGGNGVVLQGSANTVGGTTAAARNIISGNGDNGVLINTAAAQNNVVAGNYLGLTADGTSVHRSNGSGVRIENAPNNTVGGTTAGARNIITGNDTAGITIAGATATGNLVQGNYIGTNPAGGSTFSSSWDRALRGVRIEGASGNVIGGTTAGARNVISLNQQGISVWGASALTQGNRIEGNYIGTDPTGLVDQGNFGAGISMFSATSTVIGGTDPGAGNVIAGNSSTNIFIEGTGAGNRVQGNIIGLDATGETALVNGFGGISARSAETVVGGTTAGARNIISGHPQHGIEVSAEDILVQGNYIGTDIDGTTDLGNGGDGVMLLAAGGKSPAGSVVGGTVGAARNVISGNGTGVTFKDGAAGATAAGNYIGVDATGATALGNGTGVSLFSAGANTVGGSAPGSGNVISGNTTYGVSISINTHDTVVAGNLIGTNAAGTSPLGSVYGIYVNGTSSRTQIGGTAAGAGNVVAGHQVGIAVDGTGTDTVLEGNFIGTDRTGTLDMGNTVEGVRVMMNGTRVGGVTPGAANVIAHGDGPGITLSNAKVGSSIRGNSIYDNGTPGAPALGIDNKTSSNVPEPNDVGDADTGANNRQNYPVLTGATSSGGATTVSGTLNSEASKNYNLDFYATPACDALGNGEGQHYLGALAVSTDGSGNAAFSAPLSGYAPGGWVVTSTATDPVGNTSEFSACSTATGAPGASISDVEVTEGNSGSVNAVFTVELTAAPGQAASVGYTTSDGSATAPGDYATTSGTLNFSAAETSKTISVPVNGDTVSEQDETFTVTLSSPTAMGILDGTATGTILSDDPPAITVDDIEIAEGSAGTSAGEFTVSLSRAYGSQVTVQYATSNGTATGPDYAGGSGTLTFEPGVVTQPVPVTVTGDTLDEPDETFTVALSAATGGVITDATGTATILDDDAAPSLTINNVAVSEGNSGSTDAVFTVTASAVSGRPISVTATTGDDSATAPDDYAAVDTTVSIPAGSTTGTVTVQVAGDVLDEQNQETFNVDLSSPVNATVADSQGVGTINDDDAQPTLSVSDETVLEGDTTPATATFEVTLSAPSGRAVLVNYNTTAGSATAGADYTAASGGLTFNAGQTVKTVDVSVLGDMQAESNETFNLVIGGPTNATIADSTGTGTIIDNDTPLTVSAGDESAPEPGGPLTFDVQLSRIHDQQVSVAYATAPGSATTADYIHVSGTAVFPAGTTLVQVPVTLNDDDIAEQSETFQLQLSSASAGLTIADATAVGTITDAADTPAVSIANTSASEAGPLSFTVSLNRVSTTNVTATYTTSSGTATSGSDFPPQTGIVTVPAGAMQATQQITVANDTLDEPDETLTVTLSAPSSNATLGTAAATGTILDDDAPPIINVIDAADVTETNTGDTTASFTVALSAVSGKAVTFNASTANGTALAPADYTALTAAPFTIPAGAASTVVAVTVKGDTIDEPNEIFQLLISGVSNANPGDAAGQARILDNDPLPALSVADASGGEAGGSATFAVSLDSASGQQVTVQYATTSASHSATAGDDYTGGSGQLVFAPGETSKNVNVPVANDTLDEDSETFGLILSAPTNAAVADGTATGTIADNDDPPSMSIADTTVQEGDEGSTLAEFAVTLSAPSGKTISAAYEVVASGDATGADVALAAGPVNLPPGQTSTTISVAVQGDTDPEADETYSVVLSNDGDDVTLGDATAIGTINDDDAPELSVSDNAAVETDGTLSFAVSLSQASAETITVDVATADGTAGAGDYTSTDEQLTFLPGEVTHDVSIPVTDDNIHEVSETFAVHLSSAVNAALGDAEGTGTITDPEDVPSLSVQDVTVDEGDGTAEFQMTMSNPSAEAVAVPFSTQAGTAAPEQDYVNADGGVVFNPGATTAQASVPIVDDAFDEPDESFSINLTEAPGSFTLDRDSATATIQDNDDAPALTIGNVSVTERDTDAVMAHFQVSLSVQSGREVTVAYATAAGTATSADFTSRTGTLTFAEGEDLKLVSVPVRGDLLDEANERFTVMLSTPTNATIADGVGQGTILDDDPLPLLTIANRTVTEGDTGSKLAAFTVRLNRVSGRTVTVLFRTVEDTAVAPSDFEAKSGKLTFTPGQLTKTISVKVFGDTRREPDEQYKVVLSSPANAAFGDRTAVGRILNDD